jgi:hypothetical protein
MLNVSHQAPSLQHHAETPANTETSNCQMLWIGGLLGGGGLGWLGVFSVDEFVAVCDEG